jgi:hypothetical protein
MNINYLFITSELLLVNKNNYKTKTNKHFEMV